MSDLISRSELIKFFEEHMRTAKDFREIIINIIPTIKNQPTAYDIGKVVEELPDDVCEWEKGSSGYVGYPAYYSKCCTTNSNGLEMQSYIIADWKFCPYCGKKIKIVGD